MANFTFFDPKNRCSNIKNVFPKIPQVISAKICQKDAFMPFYMFYQGDSATNTGEREIRSVYITRETPR